MECFLFFVSYTSADSGLLPPIGVRPCRGDNSPVQIDWEVRYMYLVCFKFKTTVLISVGPVFRKEQESTDATMVTKLNKD